MPVTIKNKDTLLHTLVSGTQNKETVILLHGGPGVPEDVDPIMEFMAEKYRVIYFHQRGTMNSPCPSSNYSIKSYISDIDEIASHFKLQQFHLFGHSWGGLYAGIYAERKPGNVLSLFLCSPGSGTGKQWVKMGWEVRKFNKKKSSFGEWVGMLRDSFLGTLGIDSGHKRFFKQFALNSIKEYIPDSTAPLLFNLTKARAVNRTNKAILKHPKLKRLTSSKFPITVTYGDDDIYGDSTKYVKKRYPTAQFITIENCSHMEWLHNEKRFFEVLAKHYDLPY